MKKSLILFAAAALILGMTSCTDEPIVPQIGEGNGDIENGPRVKTTADLDSTDWTATLTIAELLANLNGFDMGCVDSIYGDAFDAHLNFDGTYAHFTFSSNVEIWGMDNNNEMQQLQGVNFEYTYNGSTHTGNLQGLDEEGNPVTQQFTYDDATDAIHFAIPMYYSEDTTSAFNFNLVFHRD